MVNPFFDDPETSHLLMNCNLDPNPNFFTTNSELLSNCIYLTSSEFNKIPFPPDAFSAFHINIRGLPKHFDDLSEYLLSLNMLFSVVAVSETWLHKSNSDLFIIPGYHFISDSREHKLGGGVGLYIQSDMSLKPRIDLQSSDNSLCESVFVEIICPYGKNIIVGCLYRPPDAPLNDFNRSVEDILSAISFENKLSYIMGDFNINIFNSHSHQPTNEFINLMTSNSLYPLISKPTRITSSAATLIDNIFTNNLELNMNSGILYADLSDHLPVFQGTHLEMIFEPPRQKRFLRAISPTTMSAFRSKLEDVDWSSVYSNNSVNESYDTFSRLLTSACSMSFPLQPACSKPHCSSKPWFSIGLLTSCKRENSLYKQFQLNPTALNKLRYNKYRTKYNFLIKLARKKFFHDKLLSVSSDLRKTWSVVKQIISKKEPDQRFNNMKDSYTQILLR